MLGITRSCFNNPKSSQDSAKSHIKPKRFVLVLSPPGKQLHHDDDLKLELSWQDNHSFGFPFKALWHRQGAWTLHLQLALRELPTKPRKCSSLSCERQWFSRRNRDPAYGWNAAVPLPGHDLGQAAQALWSQVSSSPKQWYDIQVGWGPHREVLSPVQAVIIPRPGSKAQSNTESRSLKGPWRWHPSQQAGFVLWVAGSLLLLHAVLLPL